MPNSVKIAGITVDADDPCALAEALAKARLRLISGEQITDIWVQDFNGQRRTRYQLANLTELDKEIARLRDLCEQSKGGRKARFAIRAGFRRI